MGKRTGLRKANYDLNVYLGSDMHKWLDRLLHGFPTDAADTSQVEEREEQAIAATAWLEALEGGLLKCPSDPRDVEGWNRYWTNHLGLSLGKMQSAFSDMMASDPSLPERLARMLVRTILCAGHGLSTEATALALYGFDVTAVDISEVATRAQRETLAQRVGADARSHIDAGGVAIFGEQPLPPELCLPMHRNKEYQPRGGGRLAFVTGNLLDGDVAPGPFDVIIERCTVQLFPPALQEAAFDALSARLTSTGLLITHQHAGAWRPHEPRDHFANGWIASGRFGFTNNDFSAGVSPAGKRAQLIFTSG